MITSKDIDSLIHHVIQHAVYQPDVQWTDETVQLLWGIRTQGKFLTDPSGWRIRPDEGTDHARDLIFFEIIVQHLGVRNDEITRPPAPRSIDVVQ